MIEIQDLTFEYQNGDGKALDSVSLKIEQGDFVGIIGTSGAGKTTLAMTLSGIIPHKIKGDFYGSVLVDGEDTVENPCDHFARKIGQVFQDIDSQMVASVVEDEILFGMENFGIPHEEIGFRLEKVLSELGITELRTREIASLSGGQKQKVAIASILALEPEIIVLDEPTGELDPESSREIFTLLKKLNEEKGITVVIIEQKIMLLCEYVKKLLVINEGKLCFEGIPREVVANTEAFTKIGINIPRVAELYSALHAGGLYTGDVPMSVDDGEKMLKAIRGEK